MIKTHGRAPDGSPVIMLGISAMNWDQLMQGRPIVVDLADFQLPRTQIVLLAGQTEKDIAQALEDAGRLAPGTVASMPFDEDGHPPRGPETRI